MKGCTRFVANGPSNHLKNNDLPIIFSNIEERTDIQSRNIAESNQDIVDIALEATQKLMRELGISNQDIGSVVFSTSALNHKEISDLFSSRIGVANHTSCNFACSGFPRAIEIAEEEFSYVDRHVLIINADIMSRIVDWENEHTAILFGDMVTATTVHRDGSLKILNASSGVKDDPRELLKLEKRRQVLNADNTHSSRNILMMNGKPLYMEAPIEMIELVRESISGLGIDMSMVSHFVHHQANGKFARRLEKLLRAEGYEPEVLNTIAHSGNVGGASIPYAMTFLQDRLYNGALVACPAVGAGPDYETGKLTNGSVIFRKEE